MTSGAITLASKQEGPGDDRAIDALLRWAVRSDLRWTPAAVLPILRREPAPMLTQTLSRHRMWGLAHEAVSFHVERGGTVHPGMLAALAAMRSRAAARNLRTLADLRALAAVLEPTGVPWAVFKGPVLAELAYGGKGLRCYADLDVLVDQAAFGDVLLGLEAAGVEVWDRNWSLQLELERAELSCVLPHGTVLDLHWHPVNDAPARRELSVDPAALLARRQRVALGMAGPTPVLDPADHLVVVALHATLSGGDRLQWTRDVASLVRSEAMDPSAVVERARHMGAAVALAWMVARAERLAGPLASSLGVEDLMGDALLGRLVVAGERISAPRRYGPGGRSGRLVTSSLRDQPRAWFAAMGRAVQTHPLRWYRWSPAGAGQDGPRSSRARTDDDAPADPEEPTRMRRASGGEAARRAYLESVRGSAGDQESGPVA